MSNMYKSNNKKKDSTPVSNNKPDSKTRELEAKIRFLTDQVNHLRNLIKINDRRTLGNMSDLNNISRIISKR